MMLRSLNGNIRNEYDRLHDLKYILARERALRLGMQRL